MAEPSETEDFYSELFTRDSGWSTPYPNLEEARRAGKILPLLSALARERGSLRIVEVGCGRGWLTSIADAYGECVGVEPIEPVVRFARERYPELRFEVGTAPDLVAAGEGGSFDVVLTTEVIEHVPVGDREEFVADLKALLVPEGSVILTTDRGELHERWARRRDTTEQPEENWMTERELRALFEAQGFQAEVQDRAYYEVPDLSKFHRLVAGPKLRRALTSARQLWLLEGLRYAAANTQVWLFRAGPPTRG